MFKQSLTFSNVCQVCISSKSTAIYRKRATIDTYLVNKGTAIYCKRSMVIKAYCVFSAVGASKRSAIDNCGSAINVKSRAALGIIATRL